MIAALQELEDDVSSILHAVEVMLAEVAASDPVRDDLLEIRFAAQQAFATTERLVARAAFVPLLRSA